MKVGDLVRESIPGKEDRTGIVTRIDNSHRQCSVDVLFDDGIKYNIWDKHLGVIDKNV